DIRAAAGIRGLPAGEGPTAAHGGAVHPSAVRLPGSSGRCRLLHHSLLVLDATDAQLPELRALAAFLRSQQLAHLRAGGLAGSAAKVKSGQPDRPWTRRQLALDAR